MVGDSRSGTVGGSVGRDVRCGVVYSMWILWILEGEMWRCV
jgi:hypothetical protein